MSEISPAGLPVFRCPLEAAWIDYNGHLRDAFYGVIFSLAIDDLMDRIGLDARYRKATGNTLFTLEMHGYFLHEVQHEDSIRVIGGIIAADGKRLHAGFALYSPRYTDACATSEFMLLHVHQGAATRAAPFPDEIRARIEPLQRSTTAQPPLGATSRKLELR